ncbi:hypothetical protein, partial [Carboxylicivirga sp. N1E11]|uniref:hypothetical protein n=1 Tax=Carboxylicivirga longa TaxID=3134029 RepID=UPI003D3371E2
MIANDEAETDEEKFCFDEKKVLHNRKECLSLHRFQKQGYHLRRHRQRKAAVFQTEKSLKNTEMKSKLVW